ncbi:neuropilin and tolloid-like isoform X2 [Rhodnius prolixus]|uniref:neuropilin and tolloid-like isoform X2 n=1 Tax=Rhodnius prolixus TaxID=13249 RepID=UPI003D189491
MIQSDFKCFCDMQIQRRCRDWCGTVDVHVIFSSILEDVRERNNGPDKWIYLSSASLREEYAARPGYQLKLDFRDSFYIEPSDECKFDYLEIRDGANGYDPLVGSYCGRSFPPIIISTGRALWLRFHSDENAEYSGFRAVYEEVKKPGVLGTDVPEAQCHKYLSGIEGYVNKSDIDQEFTQRSKDFGVPLECMWTIRVDFGWRIQLHFNKFALKVPNDCESNFVDIFPEATDLQSRLKNFCGSIADLVQSPENVLKIRFLALSNARDSNFEALFTAFREKPKSTSSEPISCEEGEYDCEDATCISDKLKCNGRINCRFRSDEDPMKCQKKQGILSAIFNTEHMLIILIVFFLILTGMCCAFLFNCFKKLIRDHRIIQEHMRRTREGRISSPKLAQSTSRLDCHLPSRESLVAVSIPEPPSDEVEMRDSQCQTRESLFHPTDCSVVPAAPGFTTFGYGSSEEETTQPPSSRPVRTIGTHHHHYHLGGSDPRALSVESTKSAPDVIITH